MLPTQRIQGITKFAKKNMNEMYWLEDICFWFFFTATHLERRGMYGGT